MEKFFDRFRLLHEKEDAKIIIENISHGVSFRGTNLWILIFAVFIASLGLNVNSTAVIIGAMLISPLMGPIMGLGLGLGINDLQLLKRSLSNFGYAVLVSFAASTTYFVITPLYEAHSEILSRTSPTIYDVLIAIFGGLAGIVATSSKLKGNVIPGVAIATALMPPLCTAGYGIATLQFNYLFGALYLFVINSVFIAAATFATVRLLKIPRRHLSDKRAETRAHRWVIIILIITIAPSIYFGYDIVQQDRFNRRANRFIEMECTLPNDYLLNKKIEPEKSTITLTYGGREILEEEINRLKMKLSNYGLTGATLNILQGFAYLNDQDDNRFSELTKLLQEERIKMIAMQVELDSIEQASKISKQLFNELSINYKGLNSVVISPSASEADTSGASKNIYLAVIDFKKAIPQKERNKIQDWLRARLNNQNIEVIYR